MNLRKLTHILNISTRIWFPLLLLVPLPTYAQPSFPESPSGPGASTSVGGGTRGGDEFIGCTNLSSQPLAILTTNRDTNLIKFVTYENELSFADYIPETTAEIVEFSLQDENENQVYTTFVDLPIEPEVLEVKLPKNNETGQQLLEEGREYTWVLSIICDDLDPSADQVVQGNLWRAIPEALPDSLKNRQKVKE